MVDPAKTVDFNGLKPSTNFVAVQKKVREALWKRGEFLSLVLDKTQQDMVESYKASDSTFYVWLCSRRLGKSVALFALANQECQKTPNTRVLYLSKTTDNVREITDQVATVVLADCPLDIKPKFNKHENKFVFPNGSEIRVKGIDLTTADAIRGVKAQLVILDEFCFMKNLNSSLKSVIMPMVIDESGRVLLASSAPSSPGHESIEWIAEAKERDAITVKTIYDCTRWNQKQLDTFIAEAGGADSSTFLREYMCEIVVERDLAILPSFTAQKAKSIVQHIPFPMDHIPGTYVSLDIGFRDLSVALFGWWDYENARLIIQDEIILKGSEATTENIAREIREKESAIWPNLEPHKRVCDTDPRLIEDLKKISNLRFRPTKKDNKEAQINQTNIMLDRDQIVIDPKCKTLINHMLYGVWNAGRTSFVRTSSLGHCDAIDALLYMVRNIDRNINPYAAPPIEASQIYHGKRQDSLGTLGQQALKKIFGRK